MQGEKKTGRSRERLFKAGSENASELVRQLTPQQKLDSRKASDSGLAIAQAKVSKLEPGEDARAAKLDKLRTDFGNHERLPILDDEDIVQACIHPL